MMTHPAASDARPAIATQTHERTLTTLAHVRAALSEDQHPASPNAKQRRDQQRGYSVDKKRLVIAYTAEVVIIAASLCGAWLFANAYGHNDWQQIAMMMLAPVCYAVVEFCRVPLAVSIRAHTSVWVRALAILGVICASGVTVKSISQLGEIMFRPRLYDVVHAEESLKKARDEQAFAVRHDADADAEVVARRKAFDEGEQLAKEAAQQLANLPKDQCHPTSGITPDGRAWRGQRCTSDPRIGMLRDHLREAANHRDILAKSLEDAVNVRARLDRTQVDNSATAADGEYREAILHSQLHSFAGMVFGKSPTEVTDQEIHLFLRIFVFLPAIFVAFASTLIAFTAIQKIDPELIPLDPQGAQYLLRPVYDSVVAEAVAAAERAARAATIRSGTMAGAGV
jgi:hypothetical protein